MRATPWSPDGSDNAFDIQVGMERPGEMVPRDPGEVLMENKVARTYLRRADFEQWGLSEGCPECWYLRTGQGRQQAHSEACRKRIEGLLKGDSMGAAQLAAADERINRALADALEKHAAKRIRRIVHENDKNEGLSHVQNGMENLMHHDEQELLSVLEGWHWDDNKGGDGLIRTCAPGQDVKRWSTFVATRCTQGSPAKPAYVSRERHSSRQDGRRLTRGNQVSPTCARGGSRNPV